jgi:hypothetical protein
MKKIFKILLVIIIFLFFLTSILYGLRITNTSYQYEYLGNALVITIPNKLWFETNSQQDSLVKDSVPTYIFENNLLEYTPSGYNIGYLYPTYTAQIANGTISKTDVVTREKDTLNILRTIKLEGSEGYDSYTSKITFSEFGSYANNTFSQEGCNIHISSQNGDISYIKDSSIILISYKINEMEYIRDTINIIIECKGL